MSSPVIDERLLNPGEHPEVIENFNRILKMIDEGGNKSGTIAAKPSGEWWLDETHQASPGTDYTIDNGENRPRLLFDETFVPADLARICDIMVDAGENVVEFAGFYFDNTGHEGECFVEFEAEDHDVYRYEDVLTGEALAAYKAGKITPTIVYTIAVEESEGEDDA